MKTIKIIDLFVKIANGEEVPKKIKYKGVIREYDYDDKDYIAYKAGEELYLFYDVLKSGTGDEFVKELNNEVEIIEEDKEIEDTKYMRHHEGDGKCYIESKGHKYYVPYDLLLLIDDLVKAVNELKKGK